MPNARASNTANSFNRSPPRRCADELAVCLYQSRTEQTMSGPCTGLTVLDFSLGMPGALCTLVMADFGADVIKVEPPGGDPFRFQPAWISWNRGKKGVVLDLATAEGREHALELIGAADVLVESFRPGDMADWGLSYNTLSQR